MIKITSNDYKLTDANILHITESAKKVESGYGDTFIESVFVSMSNGTHRVVIRGHVSNFVINSSSEDRKMYAALSSAISKFKRQVRKRKTKLNRKDRNI
ncbi:HPF/RaiA family ribosome-associated protein [Photobacterium leiognathi]|uniref:HPF/RaiA family ribosome-associated protein n=1 Tax=Photobacterium leiognathi TaxID=553611 RepID=UPI001EDD251C|nr:HPF/RaiA family ribosome-associated protein [Photobacterium leiognathi]MCG3883733.1 HPF/RaiA family ribosome-associated protein [Photobacterium leiognathi]